MNSEESYKPGDPRLVLAKANENPNQPPTELLWGSQDPRESLRMARIIVEGGFLMLALNSHGAESFTYLKGASAGIRVAYFVDSFGMGAITEAPMLHGQFLFEFEKCPHEAFKLSSGGDMNRIYFRMDGPGQKDKRVEDYEFLTEAETEDVRRRLELLAVDYPKHKETVERLLSTLGR